MITLSLLTNGVAFTLKVAEIYPTECIHNLYSAIFNKSMLFYTKLNRLDV